MIVALLSFCHLCICPTVTLGGAVLEILDQGSPFWGNSAWRLRASLTSIQEEYVKVAEDS